MAGTRNERLARTLGLIAALLAWSAAGVRYFRTGVLNWEMVAAGAFFAAMVFAVPRRGEPPRA